MEQPDTVQLARKHRLLLVTVALGILLNPLNSSMIAVALARLQQDFHLTFADASWLISTYYLASAIGHYDSQLTGVIMLSVAGFRVLITPWVGRLIDKS